GRFCIAGARPRRIRSSRHWRYAGATIAGRAIHAAVGTWPHRHRSDPNGVVIYFGYTSCPDACPTALNKMGVAFASDRKRTGLMGDRFDLESKRILVLAPTGRDSAAACALLQQSVMTCNACSSIDELHRD